MAKTRKQQIKELQDEAYDLAEKVETLKDDLQEAFDNMPEGLQASENGECAEARIDLLDNWLGELRTIAEEDVE